MDPVAKVGELAPDFELPDLDGQQRSLVAWRGSIVVLNFWSAECDHSVRADSVINELKESWAPEVVFGYIAPNENESDDLLRSAARDRKADPLLLDRGHRVTDLYGAASTPHLVVIDPTGFLRYAGGLDDVSIARRDPSRNYLKEAVEAVKAGRDPDPSETPPFGCAIVRHAI